jgi:hypothetical protein
MEEKLEKILLDLNIGYITVKVAKRKILRLFDVIGSVCDCVIPKPKDPYHDIDRKICRDCSGNIEQTDL